MRKINCTIIILLLALLGCASKNQGIVSQGASPVMVSDQFKFTEGPASDRSGNIYFTDQPNNRIMKWSTDGSISAFMENCGRANGLYFDNTGKLLACADENNQLWSIDIGTGEKEILVDAFEGMKLNGPNDLWVDPQGGIYFTDPYYKRNYWIDPTQVIEQERVYYLSADRSNIIVVDGDLVKPNGIIGTPDGKTLYVPILAIVKRTGIPSMPMVRSATEVCFAKWVPTA
jgi:gluconolactonase